LFGSPARKDNNRINFSKVSLLGKQAQAYKNIFDKQVKRLVFEDAPFDNKKIMWVFELYYNRANSDASIELIFDLMQSNKIIVNDVSIRNYIVLSEILDNESPRIIVGIYEINKENKDDERSNGISPRGRNKK
jgi:hypothetical protein